ncbi:MAG: bifunctional adenosylcobinamide kinase/adenosylcobinamide-phosphate guanylyltransferase [Nitrospirae bacterium]|nr:bifunctional adenosylcobinamide kinase/adenosylcobinamide-phosphate guanylyltransferase [Nitrospirota bacterium]
MGKKWQKVKHLFTRHASRVTHHGSKGRLILVIGGASSGKSAAALDLAERGLPQGSKRAFVATGQALDEEMTVRIARHQASRGSEWKTEEVPIDLAGWFDRQGLAYRTIVVDCLTLWLSNLRERGVSEPLVSERVSMLLRAIQGTAARVVIVTNELGLGLVPLEASTRQFRDLAGQVNQQIAAEADEVYFILSGLPVQVK